MNRTNCCVPVSHAQSCGGTTSVTEEAPTSARHFDRLSEVQPLVQNFVSVREESDILLDEIKRSHQFLVKDCKPGEQCLSTIHQTTLPCVFELHMEAAGDYFSVVLHRNQ